MVTTQPVKAWKSDSATAGRGSQINTPKSQIYEDAGKIHFKKKSRTNYDRKMHDKTDKGVGDKILEE